MRLRVDLLPADPASVAPFTDTVLVVDVIRATTTALGFLECGAVRLLWLGEVEEAFALKSQLDGKVWLAGERHGLAPTGFDFGNSPTEVLQMNVQGSSVVMTTTNGTRAALLAAKSGKHVLLSSLRNAHASARKARELAVEELAILCAGSDGQVGLDDVYTAGVLCEYLLALNPSDAGEWQLDDGARIALTVRRQFANPLEPLRQSRAAEKLARVGLEADVAHCAELSQSALVPVLTDRVAFAGGVALEFRG